MRVDPVHPTAQHSDRASAGFEGRLVSNPIDTEGKAGDNGHPCLGESSSDLHRDLSPICGDAPGADDRHRRRVRFDDLPTIEEHGWRSTGFPQNRRIIVVDEGDRGDAVSLQSRPEGRDIDLRPGLDQCRVRAIIEDRAKPVGVGGPGALQRAEMVLQSSHPRGADERDEVEGDPEIPLALHENCVRFGTCAHLCLLVYRTDRALPEGRLFPPGIAHWDCCANNAGCSVPGSRCIPDRN